MIGKPGDRITYINKKIYVNGKPINQKLLSEEDNIRIYEETLNDKTIQIQQITSRINYPEEWVVPKICILLETTEIIQMTADIGVSCQEKILWALQIIFGCLGSVGHVHHHLSEQVKLINVQAHMRINYSFKEDI